jgi:hypothetical protein
MKLLRRTQFVWPLVFLALGCERAKAPPPPDSVVVRPSGAPDTTPIAASSTWDPSAGSVLLVAADSPTRAYVVLPDSATASTVLSNIPHPASVTLFSRAGSVQTAELPALDDTTGCIVATLNAAPPPRSWNVGFIGGVVAPIPMDSAASVSQPDSVTLVTWMNRLASALPNDSAGRFSGLPFVVRELWRFNAPNGTQTVVGNLVRQINQEATPLQERTFLIAERTPNDTTYATVYSERSYGAEETIESRDVLASAALGPNRNAAIIIVRDYGDATAYGIIERGDDGKWSRRWMSARRHC